MEGEEGREGRGEGPTAKSGPEAEFLVMPLNRAVLMEKILLKLYLVCAWNVGNILTMNVHP
jgi:hypothetical protein